DETFDIGFLGFFNIQGTASESDEQVLLELTDVPPECDAQLNRIHTSIILTPNRDIAVYTVCDDRLLAIAVPSDVSKIEVWANHPTEPTRIVVVVR
ncbi:MAG: hypothetical protein WCH39_28535, partial [Schlesneria sp.]